MDSFGWQQPLSDKWPEGPTYPSFKKEGVKKAMNLLKKGIDAEEGATAVEYSMMVTFIAAAVVSLVRVLGVTTMGSFQGLLNLWP